MSFVSLCITNVSLDPEFTVHCPNQKVYFKKFTHIIYFAGQDIECSFKSKKICTCTF